MIVEHGTTGGWVASPKISVGLKVGSEVNTGLFEHFRSLA